MPPVLPNERNSTPRYGRGLLRCGISILPMTAVGHERRFRDLRGKSANPPRLAVKADIPDRRFVPEPFGRCLHRQVGRFLAFEDAIGIGCRAPKIIGRVIPVGQQAAEFSEETIPIDSREPVASRQRYDLRAMHVQERIRHHDQAAIGLACLYGQGRSRSSFLSPTAVTIPHWQMQGSALALVRRQCTRPQLMLWTAPPPAHECRRCGRC